MKKTSSRPALAVLLALLGAAACSRDSGRELRPLLDGRHAPDVLVEEPRVSPPTSPRGNRFLTGWRPWLLESPAGARLVLAPFGRARIEIVHLGQGPRTLALDLLLQEPVPVGRSVRVEAAGRSLGSFPLTSPLEIPLPGDLPPGRVEVDLFFEPGARGVVAAAIRPHRPAGKVETDGRDLVQEGDSLVDLVHRVPAGSTLVGAFRPPLTARAGQRFDLTVEREDGTPIGRFAWAPSFWTRLRGTQRIELPLGQTSGLLRVRLAASGSGPPARWQGLGLDTPREKPAEEPVILALEGKLPPPRLVVVYVMDALRSDVVGHLGGPQGVSPVLDRLAREGVTFTRYRSVAPNTLPSTKALFTGRTFVSNGDAPLDAKDRATPAELFRRAGYRTGLFSGNVYISSAFGTDRGFEHTAEEVLMEGLMDEESDTAAAGPLAGGFNDNATRVQSAALAWLESIPPGEKAFLYLHTIHPHNPYDPPEPFRSRYTEGISSAIEGSTKTLVDVRELQRAVTPADQRRLRGLYTGSFAFNDAELEWFLAGLARVAPPEETLVVLTSDHGEELFEHGGVLHGYTLYEEAVGIPLVLWAPGRLRPARVTEPTDTLDLHATLLALCGLEVPEGSEGRDLLTARRLDREYVHFAAASSVGAGVYSAQYGKWKLIWAPRYSVYWGMGDGLGRSRDPEYLFDLEADPKERVNLAGRDGLEIAWLRSRLLAWVEREGALTQKPPARPLDPETERKLRALGYLN